MNVVGVDPGTEQSALVIFDGSRIVDHAILSNEQLLDRLRTGEDTGVLVIEQFKSMGMIVGQTVYDTCFVSGRFVEAWFPASFALIPRVKVKHHLCGSHQAKDANIRQALIDRFGPIGTVNAKGLLHGLKSHEWSALAIAVTWWDQRGQLPDPIRPGVTPDC